MARKIKVFRAMRTVTRGYIVFMVAFDRPKYGHGTKITPRTHLRSAGI